MSDLRLFIAVPLPGTVRDPMADFMRELKQELPFQKWVHPDDLHITIKFLGAASEQTMEQVKVALKQVAEAEERPSFELSLRGLGTFGKPSEPSVLWAGIHGEMRVLSELQARVEAAMAPLGFEPEARAYRPHLTLARRYSAANTASDGNGNGDDFPREKLRQLELPQPLTWSADQVVLYRSHLGRTPMYEAVAAYALDS
ncbi:RNA 2',3'-cyclic phosphodiesterase [Paenibacillus cremeus]|uniref:RNA 2',3'-cyclic phosphodiesterase n=1 Tax=Paenibacillus cremeus TaxID=2163881 RepID=A0A559KE10_9BACL|nr:RNA 2',3'-cyclic phosphodiesterase [Paenibacillus cremeus]TVY10366.1 RNA 2',3'-cyclic phosphodiesterase [Paenibacillus cremeus]